MKVALGLIGHSRNFFINRDIMLDYANRNNCDIFISTWDNDGYKVGPAHSSFHPRNFSKNPITNNDFEGINYKYLKIENVDEVSKKLKMEEVIAPIQEKYVEIDSGRKIENLSNLIFQAYKRNSIIEEMTKHEYDLYIVCRLDFIWGNFKSLFSSRMEGIFREKENEVWDMNNIKKISACEVTDLNSLEADNFFCSDLSDKLHEGLIDFYFIGSAKKIKKFVHEPTDAVKNFYCVIFEKLKDSSLVGDKRKEVIETGKCGHKFTKWWVDTYVGDSVKLPWQGWITRPDYDANGNLRNIKVNEDHIS